MVRGRGDESVHRRLTPAASVREDGRGGGSPIFEASVDLCRSLRHPDRAEELVRSTINELDEAIRTLRPVVATLSESADGLSA
jgi:hypothetical protein